MALVAPTWAECVRIDGAKLRKGPSAKESVTWVVPRHTPLVVQDTKGGWSQVVDMDGERHWMTSSNLTTAYQCLMVKSRWAKLRKGPGQQHPVSEISQVDRYTAFQRFEMEEGWYKVTAPDGKTAWIHDSAVWRPVKVMSVDF